MDRVDVMCGVVCVDVVCVDVGCVGAAVSNWYPTSPCSFGPLPLHHITQSA